MIGKTSVLTILFLFSFLFLGPSWGQLVDKVDLVRPLPVPIRGNVEVEGNVSVVNTPEVIIREIPEVSVSGDVSLVNSPEVRIADVAQVEVVNEARRSIPVQVTNPLTGFGREDPSDFFSWHRRSFVNGKTKTRIHSAISAAKMEGRPFVLTDILVTSRFQAPDAQMVLSLKGAGGDRGLGLDFILVPGASHLDTHFQTGIVFSPSSAIDILVSGDRGGREFRVDYTITFSGYFLKGS
ncbi:MAG: hypothetical protein GTN81_14965 [Proteobacteria bacterium]|nr:hypothetical protein [Pseudomonadota bacterium]